MEWRYGIMKITESKVRKIKIEDILESHRLDPISVFLEDFEPGKGKITIECYGKSWSSYWGGMGSRTISQFFCSCDNSYLSSNLAPNLKSNIFDEENFKDFAKNKIIKLRKESELEPDRARELFDEIEDLSEDCSKDWFFSGNESVRDIFGDEYWNIDLPTTTNPDYAYISRIIDTVKEALKQE
jgi:hypothetical protein